MLVAPTEEAKMARFIVVLAAIAALAAILVPLASAAHASWN
jgi:hypothetical protein